MNCQLQAGGKCFLATLLVAFNLHLSASTPSLVPVFLDNAPDDVSVGCYSGLPFPITLRAMINGTDEVDVVPFDSLSSPDVICTGGIVHRIWEVSDDTGTSRETQLITIGPATLAGPSFGPLDQSPTIQECLIANNPNEAGSFESWRNDQFLAAGAALQVGCVGIASLIEEIDGPSSGFSCGDETTLTITATDSCGQTAVVSFSYQVVDNEAPFVAVGDTTDLTIECNDPIPPAPDLIFRDCEGPVTPTFSEVSSQVMNGSCSQYEYNITRTWVASDNCGNTTIIQQVVSVVDNSPPTFDLAGNVSIQCFQSPFDINLVDTIRNLADNCSPVDQITVSFSDEIISNPQCSQLFTIERTWTVTDVCQNAAVVQQNIFVGDNNDPTFTLPPDISVDCRDADNLDITGVPTDLFDICDETPNFEFTDIILPATCPGNFRIRREWRVFDDCGNDGTGEQIIIVRDTIPPGFSTPPANLITTCNNTEFQDEVFNLWILDFAGAVGADGCAASDELTIEIYESGTTELPLLPEFRCDLDGQIVRELAVDVIVTDPCGNSHTETVYFRQIDTQPPNIFTCPGNQIIPTDEDECSVRVGLPAPTIEEQCVLGLPTQLHLRDTVAVSSSASGTPEAGSTPVDTINFELQINQELPVNAFIPGQLTISLENVDAEGSGEYYEIYGEDGSLLGITAPADIQCANSDTLIEIPRALFNIWASDGTISIQLVPHVDPDQDGNFAINDICPGESRVIAYLFMPVRRLAPLVYEVFIDDNDPILVDPIDSLFTDLDQGFHQIRYRVTDCAGNFDECLFTITVEDRQPPVIECPDDLLVFLSPDSCRAEITVPPLTGASDNCGVFTINTQQQPAVSERFLQFNFDANLNSFQAVPKDISFTGLSPIAFDSAEVLVFFRGDFSGPEDFLDLVDIEGNVVASSTPGQAECEREGRLRFSISADDFNQMVAATGSLDFTLRPRPIPVPPGMNGEGVEPCPNGQIVNGNGEIDGISYAYAELNYPSLEPDYYGYGATTIPLQNNGANPIVEVFDLGVTNFTYVISDPSGNVDSCTIEVEVRDTIRPLAVCQPTTLFIDPSGLAPESPDPTLLDGGSFDNCGLDSLALLPATFSCDQIGTSANVTLQVFDASGNIDSCTTTVGISGLAPEPAANSGLCGGDSLFLFANPPTVAAPGQTIYTYRWFNPQGFFFSDEENPVLVGIDASFEGVYRLVIRGVSGCEAEGTIQINIEDLPLTPVISAPEQVCVDDPIVLTTDTPQSGSVTYSWYEGQAGAGTLIGTSIDPFFSVPAPHGDVGRRFYLEAEVNGCLSAPSSSIHVTTTTEPTATVSDTSVFACINQTAFLSAELSPNATYLWTGPDGFQDTGRVIEIPNISLADGGFYYLQTVRGGGCFSSVDSLLLGIIPAPDAPSISASSPVCLGSTLELTASVEGAATYNWFAPNGQVFITDTFVFIIDTVAMGAFGPWAVSLDLGSCPSLLSDPVNVLVTSLPVVNAMHTPDPICAGNDLILQGSSSLANSSYSWTGPNDFTSEEIAPVLPTVLAEDSGWYILTATGPNGCSDTDSVFVEVENGLVVTELINLSPNCYEVGETIELIVEVNPPDTSGDYTYFWTGPGVETEADTLVLPDIDAGTSGNYSVIVEDADGCRSPQETFLLDVNFAPTTPSAPTALSGETNFCAGDAFTLTTTDFGSNVTYLWQLPDGSIIPSDTNLIQLLALPPAFVGGYRVRAVRNGCSSLFSEPTQITATEFPAFVATATSPTCAGNELQLQVNDLPNTDYSWTGPNDFSSSLPNPVIIGADPDLHNGTYEVIVSQGGCVSDTIGVEVMVQPSPAVPVPLLVDPVCLGDENASLTLAVNGNTTTEGATYQWFFEGGISPVTPPGQGESFVLNDFSQFPGGGGYSLQIQAELDGCLSELSIPLIIQLDDIDPDAAQAMEDTLVCEGLFLLEATPLALGTGRWELLSGGGDIFIANPNSPTTAVDGLSEFGSPYQFIWTVSSGSCTDFSTDTVNISVTNGEEAFAGEDLLVCLDQTVNLSANPAQDIGSVGTWSQNLAQEILGVIIVNPNDPNTEIQGLQADNVYSFTWAVQSNCGQNEDVVLVNVSDPNPDAGPDLVICNEEGATVLGATEPTIGSEGQWSILTAGLIIDDPNSPTTMVSNLLVGENQLVWQVDGGECGPGSMDTLVITYKQPASPLDDIYDVEFQSFVDFDPLENDDPPIGSTVVFLEEPEFGTISLNDDGGFRYEAPPNFAGDVSVRYEVVSSGCVNAPATILFRVGKDVDCAAPNIFTPNNDGVNDFFVVPCLLNVDQFPNSQVTIYNQWGDEVYRSSQPYNNDWDGTFNGDQLPVATYFYTIEFGDGRETATGHLRIQR
ncbi:MAG: gliding motility-associated C-terminal domain-containing protein [Bacteroidota bacterium]